MKAKASVGSLKMHPETRAAMEAEADRMAKQAIDDMNRMNEDELDAMALYILHEEFGFGPARLKRFYDRFGAALRELGERYQMNEYDDRLWLCQRKLKDIGIDISEWKREKENAVQSNNCINSV